MDKEASAALDESIESWEKKVKTLRECIGKPMPVLPMNSTLCPLCAKFIHDGCVECPVCRKTYLAYCIGTHFDICAWGYRNYPIVNKYVIEKFEAEVSFLKSLREES